MFTFLALLLSASLGVELAFAFNLPVPKPTGGLLGDGRNLKREPIPEPTAGPLLLGSPAEHIRDRRQQTVFADTCGFLEGDASYPYKCSIGSACATNTVNDYFGCCQTDASGNWVSSDCAYVITAYRGCYDYSIATLCTGACYASYRVCDSNHPYCGSVYLYSGFSTFSQYDCLTETTVTSFGLLATPTTTSITTSITTSVTTSITTSKTISTNLPTESTSSSVTSTTTGPTPSPSTNPHPNHTGAIVGGVLGGLTVITAVLGGVFFFMLKKKKAERRSIVPEVSQM